METILALKECFTDLEQSNPLLSDLCNGDWDEQLKTKLRMTDLTAQTVHKLRKDKGP